MKHSDPPQTKNFLGVSFEPYVQIVAPTGFEPVELTSRKLILPNVKTGKLYLEFMGSTHSWILPQRHIYTLPECETPAVD